MLTRKGSRRHRRFGRLYLAALTGLGLTAPVLAAVDWALALWFIPAAVAAPVLIRALRRHRRPGHDDAHASLS